MTDSITVSNFCKIYCLLTKILYIKEPNHAGFLRRKPIFYQPVGLNEKLSWEMINTVDKNCYNFVNQNPETLSRDKMHNNFVLRGKDFRDDRKSVFLLLIVGDFSDSIDGNR